MQSLPNIEKSAFRHGEYVGYAQGVWRIQPCHYGASRWVARNQTHTGAAALFAPTLRELSTKLEAYSKGGH